MLAANHIALSMMIMTMVLMETMMILVTKMMMKVLFTIKLVLIILLINQLRLVVANVCSPAKSCQRATTGNYHCAIIMINSKVFFTDVDSEESTAMMLIDQSKTCCNKCVHSGKKLSSLDGNIFQTLQRESCDNRL